jgi:hypothetical protein
MWSNGCRDGPQTSFRWFSSLIDQRYVEAVIAVWPLYT